MTKQYKLTDQYLTTHCGYQWELGVWQEVKVEGWKPSTNQVFHYYHDPLLAVLFNPFQSNIKNPRLFEIEIDGELGNDKIKGWCKQMKLVKEIPLPVFTADQYVEFAIRVAKTISHDWVWNLWADKWLSGDDRTKESALSVVANITHIDYSSAAAISALYAAIDNGQSKSSEYISYTSFLSIVYALKTDISIDKLKEIAKIIINFDY